MWEVPAIPDWLPAASTSQEAPIISSPVPAVGPSKTMCGGISAIVLDGGHPAGPKLVPGKAAHQVLPSLQTTAMHISLSLVDLVRFRRTSCLVLECANTAVCRGLKATCGYHGMMQADPS